MSITLKMLLRLLVIICEHILELMGNPGDPDPPDHAPTTSPAK